MNYGATDIMMFAVRNGDSMTEGDLHGLDENPRKRLDGLSDTTGGDVTFMMKREMTQNI